MKVLLDENLPHQLRAAIPDHEVFTTAYMKWSGIENGQLLTLAAGEGFDVLVTNDRGLEYELDQKSLPVAVVVLLAKSNTMTAIRPLIIGLLDALARIKRGELIKIGE